jgi:hypothetical protein
MIKKIKKHYRRMKDTIEFIDSIRSSDRGDYEGQLIGTDGDLVHEAQRLHAGVYLSRNFISEQDVSSDRRMHERADPHQSHSTYFTIHDKRTGKVIATSRQIRLHTDKKHNSFPLLEKAHIEDRWKEFILGHNMDKVVEISGLAKLRDATSMAPLYLYRQMWHHSLNNQHDLWLMACDVRLFQRLKLILGGAIIQVGKETVYQGGNVIPAIVKPKEGLHALIRSAIKTGYLRRYLRLLVVEFFIEGLPMHAVATEDREQLEKIGVLKRSSKE